MATKVLNNLRLCCATMNISRNFLKHSFRITSANIIHKISYNHGISTPCGAMQIRHCQTMPELDENELIVLEITKDNPELEQKLRVLMLEVEVMRQDGRAAPENLNVSQWKQLLELSTRSQRAKYLLYLFKTEKARENKKKKKEEKRILFESGKLPIPSSKIHSDDLEYGLTNNAMLIRISDSSMNNFYNFRAVQAMVHGQPLILDLSYESDMVLREAKNAAKQLTLLFGDNRTHIDPFNLYLCNVKHDGALMEQLKKNIPTVMEPWFPLNIRSESYLDLFPKERLVYLTPHCREELTHFDHNAVYIVGCMVDKVNNDPLSLAKAKRDGIKMAKLPLDRYLEWGTGSGKTLNINHMLNIMLDLKTSNNWNKALAHVPRRKLLSTRIMHEENKLRKVYSSLNKGYERRKLIPRKFQDRKDSLYKNLFNDDNTM